ncbi:MAG: hypothetical protein U0174_14355 [Polyangiaceae bacterium]
MLHSRSWFSRLGVSSSLPVVFSALFACGEAAPVASPPVTAVAAPPKEATPRAETAVPIAASADETTDRDLRAAIDRNDFEAARRLCAEAKTQHPEKRSLYATCKGAEELANKERSAVLDRMPPQVLPAPPFGYTLRRSVPVGNSQPPALRKLEEKKNQITDDVAWLQRNHLALPVWEVPNPFRQIAGNVPKDLPETYSAQNRLVEAIDGGDYAVLVYGTDFASGRFLAVVDRAHKPIAFFDFAAYLTPPKAVAKDASFVQGQVEWAVVKDQVLYVSTGHRTYAASSYGKNAYVTAIDVTTGELLWQSDSLVSNARNFLVLGDYIVSGYGFTAEPDFLFVLSRGTGKTVKKVPVKSGPEVILEREGKLYVRTYDTDYVFAIDGK